jgi:hypothetical protein
LGFVASDGYGQLVFPNQPAVPAIYRFQFRSDEREQRYIGETDNLSRRFAHYRKPGPTQDTNLRINALFLAALREGGEIAVSVVTDAWINSGHGRETADLSSKVVRRVIENVALLDCARAEIESLNKELASVQLLRVAHKSELPQESSLAIPADSALLSSNYAGPPNFSPEKEQLIFATTPDHKRHKLPFWRGTLILWIIFLVFFLGAVLTIRHHR